MKPHIKRDYGFWTCGLPNAGTGGRYCGESPNAAYHSWLIARVLHATGFDLRDGRNYHLSPRGIFTPVGEFK